ncbi:hypothetical protein MesoLjLb_32290 [Mesorhizobium sp. L-8-3]|nr:hypothetical protein MesoLjLb_32290 [Mesorhizobium sp. L-8-3]
MFTSATAGRAVAVTATPDRIAALSFLNAIVLPPSLRIFLQLRPTRPAKGAARHDSSANTVWKLIIQ